MPSHVSLIATSSTRMEIEARLREILSKLTEKNCGWMKLDVRLNEQNGVNREMLSSAFSELEASFDVTMSRECEPFNPTFGMLVDNVYNPLVMKDIAMLLDIFAQSCERVEEIPREKIKLSSKLHSLGIDSFRLFGITDDLRERVGIDISDSDLSGVTDVESFIIKMKAACIRS